MVPNLSKSETKNSVPTHGAYYAGLKLLCAVRRSAQNLYHVVTPRSFHYSPDDTGGAAHSCAAGHTTYDNAKHSVNYTCKNKVMAGWSTVTDASCQKYTGKICSSNF